MYFFNSGNGYISTDVLKEILRELDNKLTEEDLENIVEEVDEDSSGTLDFDGKSSLFQNSLQLLPLQNLWKWWQVKEDADGRSQRLPQDIL